MKRDEVWNPKEILVDGSVFKVGDIVFLSDGATNGVFPFKNDLTDGAVITRITLRHGFEYGPSPFWDDCPCACHQLIEGQPNAVDEPCVKCRTGTYDAGYIVKVEYKKTDSFHISRLTKKD